MENLVLILGFGQPTSLENRRFGSFVYTTLSIKKGGATCVYDLKKCYEKFYAVFSPALPIN